MLPLLFSDPAIFMLMLGGIIIAIGIHEAAHCYMADYLGDPTPRSQGRLTLNPIAHLDLFGTFAIIATGMFGWGKPSPYDPYNLQNPRRDSALIALAGPVSNLLLAGIFSLLLRFVHLPPAILLVVVSYIALNINLAVFNLIPVPPLDGSKIFLNRNPLAGRDSIWLLLLLILPLVNGYSLAGLVVSPISSFIFKLLVP